ncbi:MAG: biotin--[acetyl-CoA-carboxylase] ligase [Candidatus Omnitrophica bacterium]|nr:biotin--[acetyl-CoA-carboxylase] ligase [Candidatus Omnitrophota bacterium]
MNEKILEHLRKSDSYISGEELSHKLKISRAAVWKNIHTLIDEGYEIVAVPHLGYRLEKLTPKLLPREIKYNLNTQFIGKNIFYFDSLSSTMDKAMQLTLDAAQNGTVVIAESQSKGRGRLGRSWISPKHKGIYFSLILMPKIIPQQASILTIVIAVSVAEAIKQTCGLDPTIKWPNDILLGDRKLGGILVEMNAEMDIIKFVIVGVGLNVSQSKTQLPTGATSLKVEGAKEVERVVILQTILKRIEQNYLKFTKEGSSFIIQKWRDFTSTLHSRIKVICQKEHIEGEAVDIDLDGGLLIRKDSGFVEKVMAGDVVRLKRL